MPILASSRRDGGTVTLRGCFGNSARVIHLANMPLLQDITPRRSQTGAPVKGEFGEEIGVPLLRRIKLPPTVHPGTLWLNLLPFTEWPRMIQVVGPEHTSKYDRALSSPDARANRLAAGSNPPRVAKQTPIQYEAGMLVLRLGHTQHTHGS
jgi:hypothetical protein